LIRSFPVESSTKPGGIIGYPAPPTRPTADKNLLSTGYPVASTVISAKETTYTTPSPLKSTLSNNTFVKKKRHVWKMIMIKEEFKKE